ncbi:MAG: hypothetical protein K8I30_01545, partial [Anaerolineae bacterium]|nr:hypothetical protein [Anaerolineae bacterium]
MRVSNRLIVLIIFVVGCMTGLTAAAVLLLLPERTPTQAQEIATAAPTPAFTDESLFAQVDAVDRVIAQLYQRVSP